MTNDVPFSKTELLTRLKDGWNNLQMFIDRLNAEQMTTPIDAAGWTVKDHLIHLAVWADGAAAILNREPRHERMGLDYDLFVSGDIDAINGYLQRRDKDIPLSVVLNTLHDVHERVVSAVDARTEDELLLPYNHYQPDSPRDQPVVGWIIGNTFEHYAEHIPWMEKIVS